MNRNRPEVSRSGFSLLEVILTMAMSVVLMGLISWTFQFYTRDMNGAHLDIQQTQLASAIMQMIEDDLRATLHPEPVDMSGLEAVLAAQAGEAGGGGGEEDLSAAGIDSTEFEEPLVETPDLTSGTAILQTPGLIGNQFQIQIDVSRLPRLEEYTQMLDQDVANIDDVPSDIKTVTYFVQPPISGVRDPLDDLLAQTSTQSSADSELSGGLVRRALDRNVTQYASQSGNINQLSQTGQMLAGEVTGIEFQYWDGIIWQLEWSSDDLGELPLAIRIDLSMTNATAQQDGLSAGDENAIRTFSHVVRLPMAIPIDDEEDAATQETTGTVQ